jgi:oxaloacetate decarboxylase alpha subunit
LLLPVTSQAKPIRGATEFVANTSDAHAALWHTLLSVDLVGPIFCREMPADDPLPYLLTNPRALETTALNDGIWVNVRDVADCFSARRYGTVLDEFRQLVEGGYGTPPAPIDPAVQRAVELLADPNHSLEDDPPSAEDVREAAEGLAASEEDLVLLAMFGEEAETMLQTIRQRHSREASLLAGDVDATRAERIRELVRIVQESGVGEIEIEDEGMRVSVRRAEEPSTHPAAALVVRPEPDVPAPPATNGAVLVESPMVGVFYRSPEPGAPAFVEIGDVVASGQTLCLLEAMKLFNELKSEHAGVISKVLVEDGTAVEFGQPLFELEP